MKNYKFVIFRPNYGDVYDFCYKDAEKIENVEVHNLYVNFSSNIERKIHKLHFNKKINLPFKFLWNNKYFPTSFSKDDNIVFILFYNSNNIYENGAIENLRKRYPNSKIILFLNDIIEKNFGEKKFEAIKSKFDLIFSFDYADCEKYDLIYQPLIYPTIVHEYDTEHIDVYFCGKAKNRLNDIVKAFDLFTKIGLRCLFIISGVPEEKQMFREGIKYINEFMPYQFNLEYIKHSKCLFEINQEKSVGYTLRTCEAICHNKKLITNNPYILRSEFYDAKQIYLYNDNIDQDLKQFLEEKFNVEKNNYFKIEKFLENIVNELYNIEGE